MKRTQCKNRAARLLARLLICALLAALTLSAQAALSAQAEPAMSERGTMKVKLTNYASLPAGSRVSIALYQIGDIDPSAASGWRMHDKWKDYGVLEATESSVLGKVAENIAAALQPSEAVAVRTLDAGGATVFADLQPGIYLGALRSGPAGLRIMPFIVTIPTVEQETRRINFEPEVEPKPEYVPPTPTPSPTPEPPPEVTPTPEPTPAPTIDVPGQKVWQDESNAHGKRPASITVTLMANGEPLDAAPEWTVTSGDAWSYVFHGLPELDENGEAIAYTVVETPVEWYETSIDGTTITNRLIPGKTPEYTTIDGRKTWNDGGSADRPNYITVRLLQNGSAIQQRTVTAANNWSYSFQNLPVDDGYGNRYSYAVREDGVPGYFARTSGYDLINTRLETPPPDQPRETPPPFEEQTVEELEELIELFDYEVPLWGVMGTGDETPAWPYVSAGVGAAAVALLIVLGRRRKKNGEKDK